jgi:hypothetical protein
MDFKDCLLNAFAITTLVISCYFLFRTVENFYIFSKYTHWALTDKIGVPAESDITKIKIHPILKPYVREFYKEVRKRQQKIHLNLKQVDMVQKFGINELNDGEVIGVCYTFSRSFCNHIEIKSTSNQKGKPRWKKNELRWTVWHELGHAVLGLEHSPKGIMSEFISTEPVSKEEWGQMVDYIFKSVNIQ